MDQRVGGSCCWCCTWLSQRLYDDNDIPDSFKTILGPTNGYILPWAPPVGMNLALLRRLKRELELNLGETIATRRSVYTDSHYRYGLV